MHTKLAALKKQQETAEEDWLTLQSEIEEAEIN